jgi:O-antigen/teichoic acid export membrane protein
MRHAGWLMLGALAMNLINMGDYFVIGFVVGPAVVGVYFFAFQLVAQMTVMLSDNLQQVLFPTLTRLQDEPERLRSATLRTLRAFSFLAAPASLGLAVTIPFIEQVIWQGKFAHDAVPAVQILCLFFAFRLTNGFTMSVLKARGAFQGWFWTTLVEGVGVVAAATLGAWLGGQPWTIALAVGVWAVISRLGITLYAVRPNEITPMEVADALLRPLLLAVAAGAVVMIPSWALAERMEVWLAPVTALAPAPVPEESGWAFTSQTLHALLMLGIQGVGFSILFLALARLLAARQFADCLDALPARIATVARRLLRLA